MLSKLKKAVVCVVVGSFLLGVNLTQATAPALIQKADVTSYEIRFEQWLDTLSLKESRNRSRIKILDTNGYYSYGCLQFQRATFDRYSALYGIKGDLYDCQFQKKLARLMIEDNYAAWKNWYHVTLAIGKPPRP